MIKTRFTNDLTTPKCDLYPLAEGAYTATLFGAEFLLTPTSYGTYRIYHRNTRKYLEEVDGGVHDAVDWIRNHY